MLAGSRVAREISNKAAAASWMGGKFLGMMTNESFGLVWLGLDGSSIYNHNNKCAFKTLVEIFWKKKNIDFFSFSLYFFFFFINKCAEEGES